MYEPPHHANAAARCVLVLGVLFIAWQPATTCAQILGANFNELPGNVDPVLLDDSRTTWVRGFFNMFDLAAETNLQANNHVRGMQRAADAGRELMVSFKWNFDGASRSVPAPGSPDEQELFDLAVDTLRAIDRPVNSVVLGNEPMWETLESDMQRPATGQRSPLANFTERLLEHIDAEYGAQQSNRPRYYLGALNRLDQQANRQRDLVQDFFEIARENPKIAGIDLHIHYSGITQAEAMMSYARQQLGPEKDILASEFSPVWRYQAALDDAIGASPQGAQFAQQYGYDSGMLVMDYLAAAFEDQVSRQEWTDFIVSQPWFNVNHLADMRGLFRQYGVSIGTLGFAQPLSMRGLDPTRPGYPPFHINWLYIQALVEDTPVTEAYNEPYMQDWLAAQDLIADLDRDGDVDRSDYDLLEANLGDNVALLSNVESLISGDMNLDRVIDDADLALFDTALLHFNPDALENSDFNGDGSHDLWDLLIFREHWLQTNSSSQVGAFTRGDRNRDGVNNLADWVLIRQDFINAGSESLVAGFRLASSVPEPMAVYLALAAAGACSRRPRLRSAV